MWTCDLCRPRKIEKLRGQRPSIDRGQRRCWRCGSSTRPGTMPIAAMRLRRLLAC